MKSSDHRIDWRLPALFLVIAAAASTAAVLIGISDHPPGLALLYLASASFVLTFAHRWRSAKSFVILLVVSLLGFPVAVLAHNLLEPVGEVFRRGPREPSGGAG